ncbi:hypothetical protein N0V82_003563 [Gnomoniopsis sp. IMI 355080]|nr:hypothetical protein N0V82_003563 [Gnomoniopsis sp. IMI 355080]
MASTTETSVELTPLTVWPIQQPSGHGGSHVPDGRADTPSGPSQNTATGMATVTPEHTPNVGSSRLSALTIALLMTPLCLSVLLSSLDLTMVTPAIPSIAGSFHSSSGFVWVGGAFVLASTATTPVWGTVADMDMLIAGRGVQGVGASGMGTMVNTIICDSFSMRDLPIGGVVFIALFVFLKVPSPNTPILAGMKAIDWTGCLLIVGSALMVLLGLDFGGITYPWSSVTVVSLLAFGLLVFGFFVVNEWKLAANPVIPLRLFTNTSTLAAYAVEPPLLAAQATVPAKDTAAVIATMSFLRSITTASAIVGGGIIFQDRMQALNNELGASIGHKTALQLDGSSAAANVNLISSLTLDQQALCVVAAGISLLSIFFVRGHHLSADSEAVVLGLERTTQGNNERDRQPGITANAHSPLYAAGQEGGPRLRMRT